MGGGLEFNCSREQLERHGVDVDGAILGWEYCRRWVGGSLADPGNFWREVYEIFYEPHFDNLGV